VSNKNVNDNNEKIIEKMQAAIEQLEFKVAYQEDNAEQLNDIVTNQQFAIDRQTQLIKGLVDKVKTMQVSNAEPDQGNDLPPHY
jgi:SlyX protein